jgi:hypothetical protein
MLNIKTYNKTTASFDSTINMVEPKNLIKEESDNFATAVQVQAMHWTFCNARNKCDDIRKEYPQFDTLKDDDISKLSAEEVSAYSKYLENKAVVTAYENYSFTEEEQELLKRHDKLPTMVRFYASFLSSDEGICMNGFDSIYKKCRSLFNDYILTDTTDAMNSDESFKALRKEIVTWYNNLFKLAEDNEYLTARGSSISKVSASFVKLLVSDFKVPAKLNRKTGKAEIGSYRQMKTCKKIFRTYILAKVQNLSLDEAKKAIQDAISKETNKVESESKKDEVVKDADTTEETK